MAEIRKEKSMIKFFHIREPGPTDLTWEDKNPVDYLFHSTVDLSKLKTIIKKKK